MSANDVWAVGIHSGSRMLVERYSNPCGGTATPTSTRTATPTSTLTSTPMNTATRTPTPTATLPPCSLCNLAVRQVGISCNVDGTVHWTATVRNSGTCTVANPWQAQLQTRVGNSSYTTVATRSEGGTFPPGDTLVSGDFCYVFAPGTSAMRVDFSLASANTNCNPHARSTGIAPCNRTDACP